MPEPTTAPPPAGAPTRATAGREATPPTTNHDTDAGRADERDATPPTADHDTGARATDKRDATPPTTNHDTGARATDERDATPPTADHDTGARGTDEREATPPTANRDTGANGADERDAAAPTTGRETGAGGADADRAGAAAAVGGVGVALPLVDDERPERADAAANREKILAAAERLFACADPSVVSMDAVAAAAGVGKGTLFRRFGDRASLARAILSRHEMAFQDRLIRGAPPLGPGAPPQERLVAFGAGYLEFLERHGALLREAEGTQDVFLRTATYGFYRTHVAMLLREAGLEARAEFLADVLLLPLAASAHAYFRGERALSCEELADAHADLVGRLLTPPR